MKPRQRVPAAAAVVLAGGLTLASAGLPAAGATASGSAASGATASGSAASGSAASGSAAAGAAVASGSSRSAAGRVADGAPAPRDVGGRELASRGIVVHYPARGARKLPRVPASAYVIADAGTGQVLAARDAHGRYPPASTLKVLTAITLIPRLNPRAMLVASRRAAQTEPTDAGLKAGHRYRVSALFHALLMISANDAAVALAQATGSVGRGVALMNAEARRLQAYDVTAKLPNGLPAAGQYVSAYDEALIARQALASTAFMRYDSDLAIRFKVKRRHWETLVNQNSLLTQYRGGIGGKIGWTVASRATYIGLARRNGVTLIVTVLHCKPLHEIIAGERLLNWGFAMDGKVRPVGTLVPPPAGTLPAASLPAGTQPAASGKTARPAGSAAGRRQGSGARSGHADRSSTLASSAGPPTVPLVIGAGFLIVLVLGAASFARVHRRAADRGR